MATGRGKGFPPAGVPIALKAQRLALNLAQQTLDLAGLALDVAGGKLSGALKGEEILDAPRLKGPLKLEQVSLREWLPRLGIALPATRDPEVFKRASFASNVSLTKKSADLGDIVLQLDDTTAKGSLGIADFDAKALRFDLNVDRINADRYLPPPSEAPKQAAAKEPPAEIPVDMLRSLNARGQLQVAEATFADIKFTKLRLGVNARDGKVRFHPSEASMYGGQYRGDIGIDATGKVARVSLDEHVSGIDFAPLFKDLFESDRVSGKGSANIKLTGSGRNTDDVATQDARRHPRLQGRRRCARRHGPVVRDTARAGAVQATGGSRTFGTRAHTLQRARRYRRDERRCVDEQRSQRCDAVPACDRAGDRRSAEERHRLPVDGHRAQDAA